MRASVDTIGDVVSSFGFFGPLGPTVGARAPPQLAGTFLFDKVNSAKGFSLLTGGECRCVKWFKNVFTVELTELLQ
jgi:hypothetical protein